MTPEQVRAKVDEIRAAAGDDPERDHYARDGLLVETLRAIAAGAPDPAALASEALRVQEPDMELWFS